MTQLKESPVTGAAPTSDGEDAVRVVVLHCPVTAPCAVREASQTREAREEPSEATEPEAPVGSGDHEPPGVADAEPGKSAASTRSRPDRHLSGVRYVWQAEALARVAQLRADWASGAVAGTDRLSATNFEQLLDDVVAVCTTKPSVAERMTGAAVERAWTHLHAAEAILVSSADETHREGLLPRVVDKARRHLPATSAQRVAVEGLLGTTPPDWSASLMSHVVSTTNGLSDAAHNRARSFRNVVLAAAALAAAAAAVLVVFGALRPASLPMCTADAAQCVSLSPDRTVDVAVVALLGASGGLVTGIGLLSRVKGTATPYAIPMALAVLKVPTGALAAVLGLLVLRALAGGDALGLDTSAGLLAWAVVLGLAQETLTRLADKQGQLVLASIP